MRSSGEIKTGWGNGAPREVARDNIFDMFESVESIEYIESIESIETSDDIKKFI